MTNIDISFPVLGFKEKDADIHSFEKKGFGIVSKGHGKFYEGLILIDSNGSMYSVVNVSVKGAASFLTSLLSLQALEEVNIEMEATGSITLQELKQKVILHIKRHLGNFSSRYNGEPWSKRVDAVNTYQELIRLLK